MAFRAVWEGRDLLEGGRVAFFLEGRWPATGVYATVATRPCCSQSRQQLPRLLDPRRLGDHGDVAFPRPVAGQESFGKRKGLAVVVQDQGCLR